jgi:hypothetical protein
MKCPRADCLAAIGILGERRVSADPDQAYAREAQRPHHRHILKFEKFHFVRSPI